MRWANCTRSGRRTACNAWVINTDLVNETDGFKKDLQLNFVGSISDDVLSSINDHDLSDYVNNVGYISHKEAVVYQKKSQILLIIEICLFLAVKDN